MTQESDVLKGETLQEQFAELQETVRRALIDLRCRLRPLPASQHRAALANHHEQRRGTVAASSSSGTIPLSVSSHVLQDACSVLGTSFDGTRTMLTRVKQDCFGR